MRVPALLPSLLLAGCVNPLPAADVGGASEASVSSVIPWQLNECRYIVGWSEADPAVIQANLPEGFTVQGGAPLGLPAPASTPADRAIIGTEAFDCPSGTGLDGALQPMTYASIWIPVTPPDALADPDVNAVYYKFDVLVPDAPRRNAMQALGLSVAAGEIMWHDPKIPTGVAAMATIEGAGDFSFEAAPVHTVDPGDEPGAFMEITPAGEKGADGFAIWRAEFTWAQPYAQARGYIDWPADHWVTQAIGRAQAPASFHTGTWSFNGTLTLPSPSLRTARAPRSPRRARGAP